MLDWRIATNFGTNIHCPQKMYCSCISDILTFHIASQSGHSFWLSTEIWQVVVGCHVVADRCGATLGCDILTELELHPGNIQTPFTLFHFSIGHYCRGTVLSLWSITDSTNRELAAVSWSCPSVFCCHRSSEEKTRRTLTSHSSCRPMMPLDAGL